APRFPSRIPGGLDHLMMRWDRAFFSIGQYTPGGAKKSEKARNRLNLQTVSLECRAVLVKNRFVRRGGKGSAKNDQIRGAIKTKLTNLTRISGGLSTLALCLFFAGSAKADCSMTRPMRAVMTAPDSVVAGGAAAMSARTRTLNPEATTNPEAAGGGNSIVGLW